MQLSPKHRGYDGSDQPLGLIRAPARQLGHPHILRIRDLARASTHWAGRSVCAYTAAQAIWHLRILYIFITLTSDAELSVSNKQIRLPYQIRHFLLLVHHTLGVDTQIFLILGIILLIIWLVLWLAVHAASTAVHIFIALAIICFLLHFVRGTPERR
jgi:hypothetical protein